jgi:hypothetical protein
MRNLNQLEVRTLREGVIPKPRVLSSGARNLALFLYKLPVMENFFVLDRPV